MNREAKLPGWLNGLLELKFNENCEIHEGKVKNVKNIYCLHCCVNICFNCTAIHDSHRLLQVSRCIDCDAVEAGELGQLIDCDSIKTYVAHDARVIILKQKPKTAEKHNRLIENRCRSCDKGLQVSFLYCSLSCKIDHVLLDGVYIESLVAKFNTNFNSMNPNNSSVVGADDKEQNLKTIGKTRAGDDGEGTSTAISPNKRARKP